MEATEYRQKKLELLHDRQKYNPILKNPTSQFESKTASSSSSTIQRSFSLPNRYNSVYPRANGQPKAHKLWLPLYLIVAKMTVPSYGLFKFVGNHTAVNGKLKIIVPIRIIY